MATQLLPSQQHQLQINGFVVIPSAVDRSLIDDALAEINRSLGKGMSIRDMLQGKALGVCSELNDHPTILRLLRDSIAIGFAQTLLGESELEPVTAGQIALRFPIHRNSVWGLAPHLDGMPTPFNGITRDSFSTFNLLIGVYLSEATIVDAGNFTVWPGSHRQYESFFQKHGVEEFLDGILPDITLLPPKQLLVRKGDIVLSHYQLGHGVAPNFTPNIRYAVYFRITRQNHDWKSSLTDIWHDWPGLVPTT